MIITMEIYRAWPRLWWIVLGSNGNEAQGYAWTRKGAEAKVQKEIATWE